MVETELQAYLHLPAHSGGVRAQLAEGIHEPHLFQGITRHLSQKWTRDDDGEALRAGDGHIETVLAEQKLDVTRQILRTGGRHREKHHRRFLPLDYSPGRA